MVGLIGVDGLDPRHSPAKLGFVLSERHWGNHYATEAAVVVVWFGFVGLKLNRIHARHPVSNTASARVLTNVGMEREGESRVRNAECGVRKAREFEDAVMRAILRREWAESGKC